MSYIYLASPYSSPEPQIRHERYEAVAHATQWLLNNKHWTYSPIVHCHKLALDYKMPTDFDFWREYNEAMLSRAAMFYVLELEGWKESKGVAGELEFARSNGIPQRLLVRQGIGFFPRNEGL